METLLSDLLTFARTIEPYDPSGCASVNANAIVDEVLASIAGAIEEAGARVAVSNELPKIAVRAGHLRQLFQNLISNAIKYRSPDRIAEVSVTGTEGDCGAVFCISDNGIGIRPDYHDRIFGIFKRLHNRRIEGNGIGLALCKKIVEQYGGRIWVESEIDAGAKFYFSIPRTSA
jgi:signal transduction histidine kinase